MHRLKIKYYKSYCQLIKAWLIIDCNLRFISLLILLPLIQSGSTLLDIGVEESKVCTHTYTSERAQNLQSSSATYKSICLNIELV